MIDELAVKLDVDPLELRGRNYATSNDGTPYSSKNLIECYERAEKHWERRHDVRARSDATWKRGVGMASQVWFGGGGPPSYAWIRVGSDGRAVVVTAMQDIGTGTRTAMAQIAAEELGLPLDRVEVVLGDSARGPYATLSAGSSTTPSMGPAVRAAAADAKRQILEIAAQRHDVEQSTLDIRDGNIVSADGKLSQPLHELVGLLESAQILGKGARGPNPAGMSVLTFGVQVAEVAVDVETGEVRVERIAAVHDVGRVINPLGAQSQVEGGIIQGIGHTLGRAPGRSRERPDADADARRVQDADDRRRAGDRVRAGRHARRASDEPRLERPRRAADHSDRRRDRERDPRCDRRGRARAADPRRERCCARSTRRSGRSGVELLRPSNLAELDGGVFIHGGTEVVPLLRDGIIETETLVDVRDVVPCGVKGGVIGAGTTLAELEADATIPAALREACRLAASPQLRSMGSVGGNLLQSTRCWYWRLKYPCRLHGGDRCHAREGEHREHAIFANDFCASAHPSDPAAALLALGASVRTNRRELDLADLYQVPTQKVREIVTLEPGELILELELPPSGGERLPEGNGPAAVVLPAGRRRGREGPRRDAHRARRRGTRAVAARRRSSPRCGDAASAHGVEGGRRPRARPPRAHAARLIAAVVLAAGASSRYGSSPPKQAVHLPAVLAALAALDDVVVVLGAHDVETEARTVQCPEWERGPGASLRCGLAALSAETEAAVVVLADGPGLDPRAVDRVVTSWRDEGGDVVAATYAGVRLPPRGARALGVVEHPRRRREGVACAARPLR